MRLCEKNGVKFFIFDNINETDLVNHCFSTRIGGVSSEEFATLNLGFKRGDEKEKVTENFIRICDACGMDYRKMVFGKQIHDNKIKRVFACDAGCGIVCDSKISGFDGFMTNEPGVVLVTFHADCVPLYFVDVKNKAIALSHSGWKGTVKRIAEETVLRMKEEFGTDPKDIVAAIGPSIGLCCFQVDKPVVNEFLGAMDFANKYIVDDETQKGKFKIDLWGINKELMLKSGILEENIEITDMCTMCHDELFYSHRRMGDNRGSLAAFMSLKA